MRNRLFAGMDRGCARSTGALLQALEARALFTTYVVDSLADTVAVDGDLTLREAIEAANTDAIAGDAPAGDAGSVDLIKFDASLMNGTITLGSTLTIESDLEIRGFDRNI